MKFFENFNLNNNNINNKGLKCSNFNDLANTLNKNKLNNIKKGVQIYNKDKNNSKNKISEKKLINIIKTKKNNLATKNNNLSSSYSNNINSIIGITANSIENNNNSKGGNIINNNFNTINLDNKNNKNKAKLTNIKIEKIPRNLSNPNNNAIQLNKNSSFNISGSPINKINKVNNLNYNCQNHLEKNKVRIINNIGNKNNTQSQSIILNKSNDINKNSRYIEGNYNNNNYKENNNNIIIDAKKLSIIDIPAPTFINYYSHNSREDIINIFKDYPNLTTKEKAFYILLKSPVVPLGSQFIFSRSTKNIKKIISKKDILLNYELYLNNKIKHYEENQILYNEIIRSVFNATKIAEITLNFITSDNETQFNDNFVLLLNNKEDYNFKYYKNYIKVIYYIINEKFDDENNQKVSDNRLLANLYDILNKKGYKKIKDYLYYIFIKNNNKKENIFMNNIDKINKLIKNECPKLLCLDESLKMCRFVIYSMYLIKEIVDYGNKLKSTQKLQVEEKELIKKMKDKLEKFHNKYHNHL